MHPDNVKVEVASEVDQQKGAIPGWKQEYTQLGGGSFRGRTVHAQLDGVELFEERMNVRVEQAFQAPVDSIVFSFDMSDNTLYLLDETTCNTWVTPENYQEVSVVIKRGSAGLADRPFDIEPLILKPLQSRYCSLFCRWLSGVLEQVASAPNQLELEGLRTQVLEDCHFILEQGLAFEQRDIVKAAQAKRIIQRVLERLRQSPQDNLSLFDLSQAAGVSERKLQYVFREYAGMSPTQWLRTHRLNSARRDLLVSSARDTTVAHVAMRWSFWHLGRFAAAYLALFGEHPSTTLGRQVG
ncbi:helix-turn-helix domain-containing protein [Pseudomonas sp. BGr12]|uniref:helix-turn-helix domain-containing protein n=1 Tax=Pseudomonas sp. BGr12 TaxID=2936269 RepID=UPI00255982DA|nr:helix-turn-helix domain-containing protein [Pseudomonas sp. BJa5]MDL2426321.1 helix-turn-helix domain-containing protein [Pseudomonas sp. BJa5]